MPEKRFVIDRKDQVVLGDLPQTVHLWGSRPENPVLLILHGGPGIPNRHGIAERHLDLAEDFIVVAWDQRGTGGSYFDCPPETLTLDRLVEDCGELIDWLCSTLGKKKVYLLGGSWGTELGTFVCHRYPDKVAGYIGYGQVVDGVENENRSWAYTMEKAVEAGKLKDIATLNRIGPPVEGQYEPVFEGLMAQRRLLSKYGGHNVKKTGYFKGTVLPILKSKELSLREKWGTAQGYSICLMQMWPTIVHYNFLEGPHTFAMPYYIFQGRLDQNTPSSLIQAYYDVIEAPDKDLIWFEHSAHGPLGEEPEKFKQALRDKFLTLERKEPT